MERFMVDITKHTDTVKTVNAIINNGGTAEIKLEHNRKEIVVVETSRQLKSRENSSK